MGRMTATVRQSNGRSSEESKLRGSMSSMRQKLRSISLISILCISLLQLISGSGLASDLVDSTRYIVGPGDKFTISFSKANISAITTEVGAEGSATIDGVGAYSLAGLTLTAAKARMLDGLNKRFAGSGPELNLSTVREKRTLVAGAVKNPGLYDSKATALVSDLIRRAGGLLAGASRRNIEIRSEQKSYGVDFEMFTLAGDLESNPAVYLGDVIFVPIFTDSTQRCYVSGQVRSPRWIEFSARDDVTDLLKLAGGLTGNARGDSVLVFEGARSRMVTLEDGRALSAGSRVIALSSGEQVLDRDISITGAVVNPGRYPFDDGMSVESLISMAGGTLDDAYTDGITLFNSSSDRKALATSMTNAENNSLGKANLFAATGPGFAANLRSGGRERLVAGDSVVVPLFEGFVSVLGQVKSPGLVPFAANKSAFDYVGLAGGINSWADVKLSYVTRKLAGGAMPLSSASKIFDGDIIYVSKKHQSQSSGALGWIRDITLIGAGVALTVFTIDKVGN